MRLLGFLGFGFLFAAPFFGAAAEASCCPMDWLPFRGYCYRLFTDTVTWSEAEMTCQNYKPGCHLASIHSQAESAELARYVSRYRRGDGHVWIGLRDPQKNREWRWTDHSSNNYENWHAGEPNNAGNDERCVELVTVSGYLQWNDKNCKASCAFLCKFKL